MKNIPLTPENAPFVSTVINKKNPDWGSKRFEYKSQPLTEGRVAHSVGSGSNSSVLSDLDFKFWEVKTFHAPDSYPGKMSILSYMSDLGFDPYVEDHEAFKLVTEELEAAGTLENALEVINKVLKWEVDTDQAIATKKKIEQHSRYIVNKKK